ncbi:DNA-3-methyladenine glycosylase [Candidatus Calescamantes bacterium]|nr:DNA-3-methyladenine glycosylase [Candidatus Calescamantes bacterium]
MSKLPLSFYQRPVLTVAPELLGKILVTSLPEGITSGKIVEVEAYTGIKDPASHVYGGKKTERTRVIFEEGGKVYVYFVYGMHVCFNIVTGEKGTAECVFIRALEPLEGIEIMKKRRGVNDIFKLTSGPAKLTQALGIDMSFYGESLDGERIYLKEGEKIEPSRIDTSPRIGIDYAGEAKEWEYRFFIKDSPFLSVKLSRR